MFLIRNLIIFPSLLLAAIFARLVSQLVAAASPGPGSRLSEHQRMERSHRGSLSVPDPETRPGLVILYRAQRSGGRQKAEVDNKFLSQ